MMRSIKEKVLNLITDKKTEKKISLNPSTKFVYTYDNIFYCCTQKTASQWFKAIFNDPLISEYTGFKIYSYDKYLKIIHKRHQALCDHAHEFGPLLYKNFSSDLPVPKRAFATHFYLSYYTYNSIPKPDSYKTFYILRDPRDIVVSWYFSVLYSHYPVGDVPIFRKNLQKLNLEDGLKYSINTLNDRGLFYGQKSWLTVPHQSENITIFRFENFAEDNFLFLKKLLKYLNIELPKQEIRELFSRHQFKNFSSGRKHGDEDQSSHYRKGIPGDWKNHFTPSTTKHFRKTTGDLLTILGYRE